MTYFRRIYHPFMQTQPLLHNTAAGSFVLWTHQHPSASQAGSDPAVLAAAVVIPTLADLAEAAPALHTLIDQQGLFPS